MFPWKGPIPHKSFTMTEHLMSLLMEKKDV